MKLLLSNRSEKELKKLHKIDQIAIAKKLRFIRDSADIITNKKLTGYTDIFRTRVGNYRIVYRKRKKEIFVVLIGHRKDVYSLLKKILG